jgi:hypothetical protein
MYANYTYCPEPLPPLVFSSSNTAVATVASNGYVTVLARGEVDVTVAPTSGYLEPQTSSWLVDPQQRPRLFYFVSGVIRENDGSAARIPNATVEILDGYSAGRASGPSNRFGAYEITRVLTEETFTLRASKEGYVPSTTTHRLGGTAIPFVDFRLTRSPQ